MTSENCAPKLSSAIVPLENDLVPEAKTRRKVFENAVRTIAKIIAGVGMLYTFICSLTLLGASFQLIAGHTTDDIFAKNSMLSNPFVGLMTGVLSTICLQSSSTTTSLVVSIVSSGILPVKQAIPIIMGSNVGTSVTNTIVAMGGGATDRNFFRKAFAGATVHDMFNWLAVLVLLPLEIAFNLLFYISNWMVSGLHGTKGGSIKTLEYITEPIIHLIVKIDRQAIIANTDLIQQNTTSTNGTSIERLLEPSLLKWFGLSDIMSGLLLLPFSLALLICCLLGLVKLLRAAFDGPMAKILKKKINADLPGKFGKFFTGYVFILIGAVMTMMVQSSSVFTSTLTPLVGIGAVTLERIFPLTLGSNLGTTITGILAAFASPPQHGREALQIALCHLLFNFLGILIWYPVPLFRKVPLRLAYYLGETTAQYKWFAILYLVVCFVLIPVGVLLLSLAGTVPFVILTSLICFFMLILIIVNVLQRYFPQKLPHFLRDWSWVPLPLRSLKPYDDLFRKCKPQKN